MNWDSIATHAKTYGDAGLERKKRQARTMLRKPTQAEGLLRRAFRIVLKDKRLVKSQWVFGPWIVDFFIPSKSGRGGVAVEVDGSSHWRIYNQGKDLHRDSYLMQVWHVGIIRVKNADVIANARGVAISIANLLNLPTV